MSSSTKESDGGEANENKINDQNNLYISKGKKFIPRPKNNVVERKKENFYWEVNIICYI